MLLTAVLCTGTTFWIIFSCIFFSEDCVIGLSCTKWERESKSFENRPDNPAYYGSRLFHKVELK